MKLKYAILISLGLWAVSIVIGRTGTLIRYNVPQVEYDEGKDYISLYEAEQLKLTTGPNIENYYEYKVKITKQREGISIKKTVDTVSAGWKYITHKEK